MGLPAETVPTSPKEVDEIARKIYGVICDEQVTYQEQATKDYLEDNDGDHG